MEQLIKNGLIHCHTENSLKDSTLTPEQLVKRARSMGAPAVTLTDHGTLTGIFELVKTVKKVNGDKDDPWYGIYDIKAIPGVEAYVQEDSDIDRMHLVLLAKSYQGYKAISQAVTKSNSRIKGGYPRFNMEIIRSCFAKGTPGHGEVIATSACVGGVIAQILLRNSAIEKEIEKLKKKAAACSNPEDPTYLGNLKLVEEYHDSVAALIERRDSLKKLADMKFTKWEKTVAKMTGEAKEKAEIELAEKKAQKAEAIQELEKVKSDIAKTKRRETAARQACKEAEKSHSQWSYYQKEIEKISTALQTEEELYQEALDTAKEYAEIFGEGNFYIELQYHGIPDEAIVMPKLARIAQKLNLPLVACNDVHFADADPEQIRARSLVSALRFNKWNTPREDDSEYYIKTDDQLRQWLEKILDPKTVDKAFQGISNIVAACNVSFPTETHFPKFKGGIEGETASGRLRRLTEEGILKRYPNQEFKYRERVEYELEVINKMQYTDYLCIVQDYLEYGRQLGLDCPEGVAYTIGPGRGSAAGSLVCYLIGITSVDPMPLGLLFERFLNPDRVSSPDIDADLSDEVRGRVLEYVKAKYGEEAVCCITTKDRLAAKAAVKAVARVRGSEKHGPVNGHTTIFYDLGTAIAKLIPNEPKIKLSDCEADLRAAFPDNEDAQEIITDALLIEGAAVAYGQHAAGVIIADNGNVGDYIALRWNDDQQQWCCQCDMVEAEEQAGLLKFDFLGLSNLSKITYALRLIKRNTGISIDIEKVPQESQIFREIFAKGKTNFVFQFESDGMKNLLKKFKPENLEHLILLNALFRPGPLQYADPICEVKSGKRKPLYICEQAKSILAITYGYPVYQEQIMQLCNKIAGFTLGESDQVRRYMSKKKEKELAKFRPKFIDGILAQGIAEDYLKDFCKKKEITISSAEEKQQVQRQAAEDYWEQLMDFAKYGFNKSHAAVYAVVAYYTAWLKYHYPTEYMTATLNYTAINKLHKMVQECKDLGVTVLAPDVNKSSASFTGKDSKILFGLSNVKNVGNGAAELLLERERNGPFRSFKDLLVRVNPSEAVCKALIDAGAFDCWCSNRAAMKYVLTNLKDDLKKINDKTQSVENISKELAETDPADTKKVVSLQKKLANASAKQEEYQERFDCTVLPISMPEEKSKRLTLENELLGMYVSGHPFDEYPDAKVLRTATIDEATPEMRYATICGIVNKLKVKKRKSDGKPMAFFVLEDETGTLEGCCFTKAYEEYGHLLDDGVAVAIDGRLTVEEDDETGETSKKISVESLKVIHPKPKKILISVKGLHKWAESVYAQVVPYSSEDGASVIVYDSALGEFRQTTLRVSMDVLQADIEDAELKETDI